MTPIKYHLCNDVLRRPPGTTEEECADLHIMRTDEGVASFWIPDARELAALCAGSPLCIGFVHQTHPPMSIGVINDTLGASG